MPRFRKRPVIIDAFQMTRERRSDNSEWPVWLNLAWNQSWPTPGAMSCEDYPNSNGADRLVISTLEGLMTVEWGDWIIRGVAGEIYPCKPEIFDATYEAVESIDDNGWMRIEEDAPIDVPLDTDVHLAWWDALSESWKQEIAYAGSKRGGWLHGSATHWRPLPAPPHHQEQGA